MKKAIFYLSWNGVFNNTNGVGTQTKTFLSGIDHYYDRLRTEFGDFAVHVLTQPFESKGWGFRRKDLQYAEKIVSRHAGQIHVCPYTDSSAEFWTPQSWQQLSRNAASTVIRLASQYEDSLVIANDVPFLHAPLFIEQSQKKLPIRSLIALYGTAYIHTNPVDQQRTEWEQQGLDSASRYPHIRIGRYSEFMYRHFLEKYHTDPSVFIPYRSSLMLDHPDFIPLAPTAVKAELVQHGIPLNKSLILAFGRADRVKGFDILLSQLHRVKHKSHLVLNVVPYTTDDPVLQTYKDLIHQYQLDVTLLTGYSRMLPQALSQCPHTKIVVCPSRGEPLSNIPFEVSIWAKNHGPVLVCSRVDGYPEQIVDASNGFLFDIGREGDLAVVIDRALALSEAQHATMRQRAYEKVIQERDFFSNFRETLKFFWKSG